MTGGKKNQKLRNSEILEVVFNLLDLWHLKRNIKVTNLSVLKKMRN